MGSAFRSLWLILPLLMVGFGLRGLARAMMNLSPEIE